MENKKPLVLISNDDGYHANGIKTLVSFLKDWCDLLVVAPESARSGFACAFSATTPLRLKRRHNMGNDVEVWSCSGTPVDCVKLALDQFLADRKPDLIIGGINHGDNSAVNVHYSGTMGVVIEGCLKGIPSIGYSLCNHLADADFSALLPYIRRITEEVLEHGLPAGICLNVNFPDVAEFKGVRICRQTNGTWEKEWKVCTHPRGGEYYWLTGQFVNHEPEAVDSDHWALNHGYVAITPTQIDVTAYSIIKDLKNWKLDV